MHEHVSVSRRSLVKSSILGLLTASLPSIVYAREESVLFESKEYGNTLPHDRYPAIELQVASEIVGLSHFDLEGVRNIVDKRPELAKAVWDWGFGDWESAIGAASHVGRRDIVDYLISKGAIPSIFTYAMMGEYNTVRGMIETYPGIQKNAGPHGISLLQHAKTGLDLEETDLSKAKQLIDYLEGLGDADGENYLELEESEKAKYLGDYKYGPGKEDGFTIKLNMRKLISLGRLGKSGGALLRLGENEFTYQGAPSIRIQFLVEEGRVVSLTLKEPGLILKAVKV